MKFKSIKLLNFMRYKGSNELAFSTNPDKNVTVVLGNNTFGKTTLAQAFRWVLYEELNATNYTKKSEIVLLNNEVIAEMRGPHDRQTVSVEIVVVDGTTEWKFTRSAVFKRKAPRTLDMSIQQDGPSKLTMLVTENGIPGKVINNNGVNPGNEKEFRKEGCVQDAINNLLPQKLSNYFFFDGERWSDTKAAKKEIRDSINTILGVTGLQEMKKHLKDGMGKTVIKTLRDSIKGSGDEYNRLKTEIHNAEAEQERLRKTIRSEEESLQTSARDRERLENELNDKRQVEDDLKEFNSLVRDIENLEKDEARWYGEIIKIFSDSAARHIAGGLLPRVDALLESIDLEGKDIPGVTVDTVDYLLNLGTCLCGTDLKKSEEARQTLINLKRVIPPEMIGGAAGKLKDAIQGWQSDTKTLVADIEKDADQMNSIQDYIEEKMDRRDQLDKKMDRKANIAALRKQYQTAVNLCRQHEQCINESRAKLDFNIKNCCEKEKQLELLAKQDSENRAVNLAIAYAEEIYEIANRQAKKKEDGVFEELNAIIAENFDKMFNDDEKYAKLEDDYRVHIYYHSMGGANDYEEQNLSNGEATAINFVYIVSVLELARRRAAMESEEDEGSETGIINLPLVLDGPFSSLSNENTNLVAKKLPEFAEQVIIFMLDKDWEASGLDSYTSPEFCYRVNKEEKANSSSLEKGGIE